MYGPRISSILVFSESTSGRGWMLEKQVENWQLLIHILSLVGIYFQFGQKGEKVASTDCRKRPEEASCPNC